MRLKPSSAARLLCFLSFSYFGPSSSADFPTTSTKSRVRESQDGRDFSSKSYKQMDEVLKFKAPKKYIRDMSSLTQDAHDFEGNEGLNREKCNLTKKRRREMKSADGSVWIINASTLKTLYNDPQELIQCTEPGDRVAFRLTGVHKFKRTLEIFHRLVFFTESSEGNEIGNDIIHAATFTCPESGPFLKIKSDGFNASGLYVQNCTKSSGKGAIVVQSKSKVMFESSAFINNQRRAMFAASSVILTVESCEFDGNGVRHYDGGAINAQDDVFLTINNSHFYGNIARHGGALHCSNESMFTIVSSKFSGNEATEGGGSLTMRFFNNLTIMNSTLSGNIGTIGGAAIVVCNNSVKIRDSTLSGNKAEYGGGAIALYVNNSITLTNTTLSGNQAKEQDGGAIDLIGNNNLTLMYTIFAGNKATRYGGAISLWDKNNNLTLIDTTLVGNNASESGGAMKLYDDNNLTFINSILAENSAKNGYGGVINGYSNNNLTFINTTFAGNNAKGSGGAIDLASGNKLIITDSNFIRNNASSGGAIVIQGSANNLIIKNTMLFENNATEFGGAILVADRNIVFLVNCSLLRNTAKWHGGALKLGLHCVVHVDQCMMQGNFANWGGSTFLERNTTMTISNTTFSSNNALRGGSIHASMECDICIDQSKVLNNLASLGGFLYGVGCTLRAKNSVLWNNSASRSGGCFYLELSTVYLKKNSLRYNKAKKEDGAIHAISGTHLQINESYFLTNLASIGGGITLASNSRILCYGCTIEKNEADRGGGMCIESQTKQIVVAQFTDSTFRSNSASEYGGGVVIKTFGSRTYNCSNVVEPCSRVVLINTSFQGNIAGLSGSAILATRLNHVLAACEGLSKFVPRTFDYLRFLQVDEIRNEQRWATIKQFNKSSVSCQSWEDNRVVHGTYRHVVETFGQKINIITNSRDEPQVNGSSESGFTLSDVNTAKQFPRLIIKTIDAFGNSPSPNLYEADALVLSSSSKILNGSITLSFQNATCLVSSISSNAPNGTYTIYITTKDDDVLEPTTLKVSILACGINEEQEETKDFCQECGERSYNFNLVSTRKCLPCPKHANCSTQYIRPNDGYWHKSPCHAHVKACIIEEACKVKNRLEKLSNITRNLDNCIFNDTILSNYTNTQCQEGYEGPLCGSCQEHHGFSSSFECKKCGPVIMPILTIIGIMCYLLLGTSITIKGVLPLRSTQHVDEDVERPLLETNIPTLDVTSNDQPRKAIEGENNAQRLESTQEETNSSSAIEQQKRETEIAKQKVTEAWKILLNFIQVTSTVATMDVEWTDEVLCAMEKLQVFSAATVNSISRPIDCLLSFASRDERVIWRTLFSAIIPTMVIVIFAFYWGYRAIMVYERDRSYFLKRLLLTIITTTYITYFDLTQVAVRIFNCVVVHVNINPLSKSFTRSWIADTSIECYKGTHIVLIGTALVVLVLVSIGFPLFCSLALLAKQDEVTTANTWAHDTLSFLCGPFKQRFVYWECVTMIKKALLSIVIVFSYSLGNQVQGLLILIVLVFFLYLHQLCNPYDEAFNNLNYFEGGSLLMSCTIYTLAQFLNVETLSEFSRHAVSCCLIVIATSFVCILVYNFLSKIIHLLRLILVSKNVQVTENTSWFSVLKLYYENRRKRPSA